MSAAPPTIPPPAPETAAPAPGRAHRVVRNTVSPLVAQLFLRGLNLGYAIIQIRLLSKDAWGEYIIAMLVWLYASTITDWGLGTLLTRNLAQARQADGAGTPDLTAARRLFAETFGLRLALSALALLPLLALAGSGAFKLSADGAGAILLLGLSLLPGSFAASASALYYAHERMGWPALVQTLTGIANVGLGVGALLLSAHATSLAAAALGTTLLTAGIFYRQMRRDFFPPTLAWPARAGTLLVTAFPLMINGLLVTIFFRFDQFIIQPVKGPDAVATYEAAYKFINLTGIITPSVTLALFPGMAHAALHDRAALARQYRAGLKVLLLLALPLVAATIALAPLLITVLALGKQGYLPDSAWALQILILYLPFSFVNGLTQYVLIALDRQRWLTGAFLATAAFNIGANLIAVPIWGIYGAAGVTVLSELILLGPFLAWTARDLGAGVLAPGPGGWKLGLAGLTLALVTGVGLLAGLPGWIVAPAGGMVYAGALLALRFFTPAEWALIRGLLRRARHE